MVSGNLLRIITIKCATVNLFISRTGGNEGDFTTEHAPVAREVFDDFAAETMNYSTLIGNFA